MAPPKPFGNNTSRASACEALRVEEKVSKYRWNELASGGRLGEVMPIMTFWACNAGLVALCLDFLASLSLRLRRVGVAGGGRADLRGGDSARIVGVGVLHTDVAKSATDSFTGV